jgi:hypothetical protein
LITEGEVIAGCANRSDRLPHPARPAALDAGADADPAPRATIRN